MWTCACGGVGNKLKTFRAYAVLEVGEGVVEGEAGNVRVRHGHQQAAHGRGNLAPALGARRAVKVGRKSFGDGRLLGGGRSDEQRKRSKHLL